MDRPAHDGWTSGTETGEGSTTGCASATVAPTSSGTTGAGTSVGSGSGTGTPVPLSRGPKISARSESSRVSFSTSALDLRSILGESPR